MIDTLGLKTNKFKIVKGDNYFCRTSADKLLPYIDTLKSNECYWTVFSDGNYQEYHLKSHIKYLPLGYRPSRIVIKDIPVNPIRFWLEMELSLPKVLYGHNFYETHQAQFEAIINSIYDMLLQFGIEIDRQELRSATSISRIDFCKNELIQTPAKDFIQLLLKFQKSRSKTYDKYDTSVLFGNKQQKLIVYDKIEEITKVLRDKTYNNRSSKEYEVAKLLNTYKKNVIRVEHRLLNRQTIKRELAPIIGHYPISFEDIFNTQVCSKVLLKHWGKTVSEEKLKLLLLGEKQVSFIFDEFRKSSEQASQKFNPLSVMYIKLLNEIGETEAHKKILSIKSPETLNIYKRQFIALAQKVFFTIRDLRIIDKSPKPLKNFLSSLLLLSRSNTL